MRSDEFLRGYDSCRERLQSLLFEDPSLQKYLEVLEIAEFPYYKEDGKDWDIACHNCKFRELDLLDFYYYCAKGYKLPSKIKNNKCELKEIKDENNNSKGM